MFLGGRRRMGAHATRSRWPSARRSVAYNVGQGKNRRRAKGRAE